MQTLEKVQALNELHQRQIRETEERRHQENMEWQKLVEARGFRLALWAFVVPTILSIVALVLSWLK